ncbi:NADP-binding protein [Dacryopinax primogenitus]|uniref:NADP-binding protein n=1 Tax=Dacryopinax primogenitus (strain DJM 731) TaxID=1858805 RepID=M5GF03_DACPD|nr:NADP-binding protein [Dacryopinax primogenitus]EJU05862.1 NADP-binding protein [Dacryopinax primogenitus]
MSPTVYLVSGANRGIGLGLVTSLVARPDVVVFAGCRNPAGASDLTTLASKYPSKLHIVKLTSCDEVDNKAAVEEIRNVVGRLDVVISNAGIGNFFGQALETPPEKMDEHFHVNVTGTLVLFQATYALLKASTPSPKFVCISSMGGTIGSGARFPGGLLAYGASKCALNYLAVKLYFEHEGLICFPIHPGELKTDMSNFAKQHPLLDLMEAMPVDEGVKGILDVIDHATRKPDGLGFVSYDGTALPW